MEKWILTVLFFSFLVVLTGRSQNSMDHFPKGALSMGLGNASVTLNDSWAVFNNIGALGTAKKELQAIAGYDHRLGLSELTTLSTGLIIPTSNLGNMGIAISSYGGKLFNQQQIGLGIANQLGLASLGIKISYFQTNMEGFGRSARPVIEFGGTAELLPGLFFGAHAYNLTRAAISKASKDYLPSTVKAGVSYRPSENLMLNFESEKELLTPARFKAGIAYGIEQKLWARVGINTNPSHLFFGIGFRPRRFQIDYAMSRHFLLGYTHHFSLNYNLSAP